MLKATISIGLLVLSTTTVSAQDVAATRQTLERLSVEWMDAVARKDRAALERILAPEYELVAVGDSAPGVKRSQWLENALRMKWENRGYIDMRIDVLGDVAVVTSNYAFRVDPGEWKPSISATSGCIDVWARRDGRWQITRRHLASSSLDRWISRVQGGAASLAVVGVIALLRRITRRRRAAEAI